MLALSWPVSVIGIIAGARLGIAFLMDEAPRMLISRSVSRLFSRES